MLKWFKNFILEWKITTLLTIVKENEILKSKLSALNKPVKPVFESEQSYSSFLDFHTIFNEYLYEERQLRDNIKKNNDNIWDIQYKIFEPIWYNVVAKVNKFSLEIKSNIITLSMDDIERLNVVDFMSESDEEKLEVYEVVIKSATFHENIKIIKHKNIEVYSKKEYILKKIYS